MWPNESTVNVKPHIETPRINQLRDEDFASLVEAVAQGVRAALEAGERKVTVEEPDEDD